MLGPPIVESPEVFMPLSKQAEASQEWDGDTEESQFQLGHLGMFVNSSPTFNII